MIPLLSELIGRVTPFALQKVLSQFDMLAAKDLPSCQHQLRTSMGLPCHHEIRDRLQQQDVLHLSDIHERWHFTKPTLSTMSVAIGRPLLMNPRIVKSKGRPKKSNGKSSTRRDPSAFEVEVARERSRRGATKEKSGRVLRPRK
jgi:hypothetical protein